MAESSGEVAALILAGGTVKPEMAAVSGGATNRALITVNGTRTMLDYVADAVRGGLRLAGSPGRLLVAGDGLPLPPDAAAVPGGASMIDTLLAGVAALRPNETRLLVVTADIPFLTPEAVADFLRQAGDLPGARFVYPIVRADACKRQFPEMRRTTLRIAEGEFTGGNLVLLDPAFLRESEALLRAAFARRKSVVGLAQLLGPGLLLRLVASRAAPGMLTIGHLEAAVTRVLGGATAKAVISAHAGIGSDVDRPEDVEIARKRLAAAN